MTNNSSSKGNRDLWKYAGLGAQIFVALGLMVFFGIKLDEWLELSFPVSTILLPLMVIVAMLYKLLKDTNARK
jgi:hypothetical protein